jgi:hypothetical protein
MTMTLGGLYGINMKRAKEGHGAQFTTACQIWLSPTLIDDQISLLLDGKERVCRG